MLFCALILLTIWKQTSKTAVSRFLEIFTNIRLIIPPYCCPQVGWSSDRTFPNLIISKTILVSSLITIANCVENNSN